ncbi:MAG: nuclear transport factor 2 family protein, partial [Planktomarina sp.]|nr:nuclear transport factor 2 family protein [Planktomarina sp.]
MLGFQREKGIVRDYYQALDNADIYEVDITLKRFTSENYTWRAFHPFNLQTDVKAVSDTFWKPFLTSFTHVQRRMDVFFAGNNFIDDGESVWVCSMGHLMGLFDKAWLGIQPTNKIAMLRYAEF